MAAQYRQDVPRPASARRRVAKPPWAAIPPEVRRRVSVATVAAAAPLMAASVWGGASPGDQSTPESAVLAPVFERDGQATLVLIRRAADLRSHAGQIALPGGYVEAGESPSQAALREAAEEVDLDASGISSLVDLGTFHRPIRGDHVAAYLALLSTEPVLVPSAAEVEAVLEVPFTHLLADGVAWEERWGPTPVPIDGAGALSDAERTVAFFADEAVLGDDLIWGLTARILWTLLEAVAHVLGT